MQAQTVDALAGGGRFIAGLGVSGPQIVEGWYGEPWGKPYWRLRDYIQIMRKIFDREGPVEHQGREISLPYTGEGATGLGKPLRSILHANPGAADLARLGLRGHGQAHRRAVRRLAADALRTRPHGPLPAVGRGGVRGRAGRRPGLADLRDPGRQPPCVITEDVADAVEAACSARRRASPCTSAAWVTPTMNFHNQHMLEQGYGDAAARIQELFLEGRKDEAAAAVPDEYVDERVASSGRRERIRQRLRDWADSGITGLTSTPVRRPCSSSWPISPRSRRPAERTLDGPRSVRPHPQPAQRRRALRAGRGPDRAARAGVAGGRLARLRRDHPVGGAGGGGRRRGRLVGGEPRRDVRRFRASTRRRRW